MTAPARSPVDDALDRLEKPWPTTFERQRDVATVRDELQQLREELRHMTDEAVGMNVVADKLREERDDAERRVKLEYQTRMDTREQLEAAEAEVQRLREGLREAETGFNDISLILEAENDGYQERAYKRAMEEWRHVRALLAANPPQGDAAEGSSPSDGKPEGGDA